MIMVVIFSGAIDRTDRKQFMMRSKWVLLLALLGISAVFLIDSTTAIVTLVLAVCYLMMESVYSVYGAALETTVADLAPESWPSARVASLITLPPLLARLIAPLIGGSIIAASLIWSLPFMGVFLVIVAMGALHVWASVLNQIQYENSPDDAQANNVIDMIRVSLRDVREAWNWIKVRPILVYMIIIGVLGNLIIFPFFSLLPIFLAELNLDEATTALLYGRASSAYGAGLMVSTLLFSSLARRVKKPGFWISINMLAIVAVLAVISLYPVDVIIIGGMGLVGMLFIGLVAIAGGTWLDMTPSEMRARIFSVRRLVMFLSIPVGTSAMGFLSAVIGFSLLLQILLSLVVVILVFSWGWLTLAQRRKLKNGKTQQ
jgi:MFS family permease